MRRAWCAVGLSGEIVAILTENLPDFTWRPIMSQIFCKYQRNGEGSFPMMVKPIRTKRRYTLMRQEIVQAARQIIQEKGIDGLSMRAIAKVVHTSPANLYEYFLNKEEIIVSVYNEFLAGLLTALQQVPQSSSGRAYLLGLCMQYIDHVGRDPSQLQIASYPTQLEAAVLVQDHQDGGANAAHKPSPSIPTQQLQRAVDPLTSAYTANTKKIFELFLQAVEKCIEEKSISSSVMGTTEIAHVVWALVHGLITLSIQDISMLDRQTMQTAIVNYLDSLSSL